ncbi:GtrA family protein, partial [Roseovarius sp. D0-M9]|uniref:GtrA family protein n=1 Tax=Roseovarius sp. D0-M9 TaxID=3127117 RepID=UPI0030100129
GTRQLSGERTCHGAWHPATGLVLRRHVAGFVSAVDSSMGITPLHANLAGFCCALLFSYVGHARFTFGVGLNSGTQILRFFCIAIVGLAISSGTVWSAEVLNLSFGAAMTAVAIVVPIFSYVALRLWVFETVARKCGGDWIGIGLSGALALGVLVLFWGRMLNHDTAWYLIATRSWLGGAELYVELIEVNPPLNFYFTLPAIWLADLFGISDTNGEYLAMAILIFAILYWCSMISSLELGLSYRRRALLLCGIAVALVLPALDNFGQREQVMVLLTLPWLLGELPSTPPPIRRQIARALVAALGICLKPHFLVFPLAISTLKALQQRSLRPLFSAANLTFFVVGLAYICSVALVHPVYLSQIVPNAQEVYGAYGAPFYTVFSRVSLELLLVVLLLLVVFSGRVRQREAGLVAAVSIAGLGSYFLQGTGFSYHVIPFRSFTVIACFFVILKSSRPNVGAIAAAIVIAALTIHGIKRGFYRNPHALQIADVVRERGPADSLMVLSSHVYAGPPAALASGASWISRYPANWLVPGAMNRLANTDCSRNAETCYLLEAIANSNRADNVADIAAAKPDILVFDLRSGYFDEVGFSWEAFLAEHAMWAQIISEYSQLKSTDRFAFYYRTPEADQK